LLLIHACSTQYKHLHKTLSNIGFLNLSFFVCFKKVDENNENKPVSLRVGQAVDIVGQAGKPKKITGF